MPEYKDETLCSGTKYCTWSLCAHRFGYFWGSPLFCTRCSKLRLTGRNGVTICTQLYIGFSRYEHNTGTILCWFPGTASRATSVHSPLVKCGRIFLLTLCAYQTDWYFRPHLASKSKVQTKSSTHILTKLMEKFNLWTFGEAQPQYVIALMQRKSSVTELLPSLDRNECSLSVDSKWGHIDTYVTLGFEGYRTG